MYPLTLSLVPGNWLLFSRRKADPAFRRIRDKVFERDQYTCQFCGFQAKEYQEVINLDNNYHNNKASNMVTSCCLCAQCFFLDSVGENDFGGGKLIYLPELSQTELNAFSHVLFCAMTNGTDYLDTAQSIYRTLKFRSRPFEEKFGEGMSNPNLFAQTLLESGSLKDVDLSHVLTDIRMLPVYAKFKKQLTRWAQAAAEELAEARE